MKRLTRQLISRLFRSARPATASRRPRLSVEALECREVLSASPVTFATVSERTFGDFAATVGQASQQPSLTLAPMMQTAVSGSFASAGDIDVVHFHLNKGEALTASVHAASATDPAPLMRLLDAQGHVLMAQANLTDGTGNAIGYQASANGDYYIELRRAPGESVATPGLSGLSGLPAALQSLLGATKGGYSLSVREVGLDSTFAQDSSLLGNNDGRMFAALSGDVLQISGPTGHGFGIRGLWAQTNTTTADGVAATYTATGTVYIQSPLGDIPLTLASGSSFTVTTKADTFGAFVGQIDQLNVKVNIGIGPFAEQIKEKFGVDLGNWKGLGADLPGIELGLRLGDETLHDTTGAPVNEAVPYFYAHFSTDMTLKVGDTVVEPSSPAAGLKLDMVLDPADPYLYLRAGAVGVKQVAMAVSLHGLIPFQPLVAPSHFEGEMFGQMFVKGDVDLSTLTDGEVPLEVKGDILVNVDPEVTGSWIGALGARTPADLFSKLSNASGDLFKHVDVAVNGEVDLTLPLGKGEGESEGPLDLSLPAIQGTLIYDSAAQTVSFAGQQPNPLAQMEFLKDTPLENLTTAPVSVDGYFNSQGQFSVTVTETTYAAGMVQGSVTVDNDGVHGTVDWSLPVLGKVATLTGGVDFDGTFSFTGTVDVDVAGQDLTVTATLDNDGLHGSTNVNVLGYKVHVHGDFDIWGNFSFVGGQFMNLAQTGWAWAVVTVTPGGIAVDASGTAGQLKQTWDRTGASVVQTWDTAGHYATQAYNSAGQAIQNAGNQGQQTANDTGNQLQQGWDNFTNNVSNFFSSL